jgi:gas vesicle protein
VKTLWIELKHEIEGLDSVTEMVKDFIVLNLSKKSTEFWKDDFGDIKEVSSYTAEELVENIIRIKQENQEKKKVRNEELAR